ncbi:hypothetical protein DM02DRAFT_618922 [Periconia macrospinosa]|uniref:Uncharacterized protein n=1 Tax=Periconia macrospinosa TaxID=97972 RepID=A0A2V1D795_9PLEO|nr:hypothetical protein DM02DRAFT_618922 [Periconia macrospinosa]
MLVGRGPWAVAVAVAIALRLCLRLCCVCVGVCGSRRRGDVDSGRRVARPFL